MNPHQDYLHVRPDSVEDHIGVVTLNTLEQQDNGGPQVPLRR
jgi:hypothetical protein